MVYVHLEKSSNEIRVFGSIKALVLELNINPNKLYYRFGRLKQIVVDTDDYLIVKKAIKRA